MTLKHKYLTAFANYVEEHEKKIESINWFYGTKTYRKLSDEELHKSFNGLYLTCKEGDECKWLKKKYGENRNSPEDWYILKET